MRHLEKIMLVSDKQSLHLTVMRDKNEEEEVAEAEAEEKIDENEHGL